MNFPGRNAFVFGEEFTIIVWAFNEAPDTNFNTILEKKDNAGNQLIQLRANNANCEFTQT